MTRPVRGAFVVLCICAFAACGSSEAPQGPPPVAGRPEQLVVIGASGASGSDLPRDDRLRRSWPQLVLAELDPGSTLVNLASSSATVADITGRQTAVATTLHPTIAVVSLEGLDRLDDGERSAIGRTVDALRDAGAATVLVLNPLPASEGAAVDGIAGQHGAVSVGIAAVTATGTAYHQQVADAIAAARRR